MSLLTLFSLICYILQQTWLTFASKTVIDNIFSNIIFPEAIFGNLTSTIFDHLPQFMIFPNVSQTVVLLLKKISKYKLSFQWKPWMKNGFQKSISVKNNFLTTFIKKKHPTKKQNFICNTKNTKNLLSTLLKNVDKIFMRNALNKIGMTLKSSAIVLNPSYS